MGEVIAWVTFAGAWLLVAGLAVLATLLVAVMLAVAVLNSAVPMINDEHTRGSAGAQPSAERREAPQIVLSNAQAGRAYASAPYQGVGVSQSAMAAADAGLANVLEPATARVTAADRADHSDGCVRVDVRAAAAGSWARPMPRRVTGCVSSASAGAGSKSRYLFLSSRSSNSIPEAESTLKLARHHASRHTILPNSGRRLFGCLCAVWHNYP
jgi:hypothetical protein